jgi:hypothetical protein
VERLIVGDLFVRVLCILAILSMDILNLVIMARRTPNKIGHSPFGILPLFLYAYVIYATWRRPIFIFVDPPIVSKSLEFLVFGIFHCACVYALPLVHWKWLNRRDKQEVRERQGEKRDKDYFDLA